MIGKVLMLRCLCAVFTGLGTVGCLEALTTGGDLRVVRLTIEFQAITHKVEDLERKVDQLESSPRVSNDAVQEVNVIENGTAHRALVALLSEMDRREWEPILQEYRDADLHRTTDADHR